MPSLRELLLRFLERAGHEVRVASGIASARLAVRPDTDVVLLDVSLPDGNGLDLATELCGRCDTLKIVFMSGFDNRDLVLPRGAVFLRKPFTSIQLDKALTDVTQL